MKLHNVTRIVLAPLLILTGAGTLWALWIWSLQMQLDLGALLIILGNLAVLGFCGLLVKELFGKGPISRGSLAIGVGLSIVTVLLAAAVLSGLYMDSIGEQCRGFTGSYGSCLFGPQLLIMIILFSPVAMSIVGALSLLGIVSQLSFKKQLAANAVDNSTQKNNTQ